MNTTILADYYDFVVAVYEKKIEKNEVSFRLVGLSPALLRDACWAECKKGYSKKDERVLADFFGYAADQSTYLKLIKNCDINKFKPLINFLKRDSSSTNLINIELLAWLIDVPHRPYNDRIDYVKLREELDTHAIEQTVVSLEEKKSDGISSVQKTINPTEVPPEMPFLQKPEENKQTGFIFKFNRFTTSRKISLGIIFTGFLLGIGIAIYNLPDGIHTGQQSCMYWSDDHFVQISCNQKMKGVLIIAFDSVRFHDFKRITKPDTITYSSIGHVWYSKIKNTVEFYTSNGSHPVQIQYQLRPVTAYMIDLYARKTERN